MAESAYARGIQGHEPVVISGISCRMPESDNMQEFRDNLMNGVDMVTEDDRRWKPGLWGLPKKNGKLKDLTKFDAGFFGVHHKQAIRMDPQVRILLELTYEAVIDAGVNPETLKGSNTGVFVAAQVSDARSLWQDEGDDSGYILTGTAMAMFSNRISFCFDLKGPSLTVDTACSSQGHALTLALNSLRNGECDAALVAGTNTTMNPKFSRHFYNMGMLSPEGICKSFDKEANGYARSEGISAMFLQKESDAKRIYCTLIHSKTNSDGNKTEGITFPSREIQQRLLEQTYKEAGINPVDVAYVETHGTGTPAGDPEECSAINEVFCKNRQSPLLIGSVKSNMGHCESAAGAASFAKVIIAMEEQMIPANLHYNEPNENISSLTEGSLKVVDENTPLCGSLVGISSFGFGGSNVHSIVKTSEKLKKPHGECEKPRLFIYGSRTKAAAEQVLKMVQKYPKDMDLHALWNESANMSLKTHPYRGFTVLNSGQKISDIQKVDEAKRPVWFVFSGMGSQWSGIGRSMLKTEVFKISIMKSDAVLKRHGVNLHDLLLSEDEQLMNNAVNAFVCITSVQVALVDMLTSIDIKSDGIIGHSVGELGCGYADGSLTAKEAVLAAYWRGRCIENTNLRPGAMAAVGLTWQEAIDQCPPGIVPACHNTDDSVTISGPADDVERFVEELKRKDTFARVIRSAWKAFHCYLMNEVAATMKFALEKVITPKPRSVKWISSSYPKSEWSEDTATMSSADYYVHNLVSPVLFQEALSHVPSNAVVIEIAPHCLLQSILKRSLKTSSCIVGLMKRDHPDNLEFCLTSLGRCYQHGVRIDPFKLLQPVEFPVPRGTPMLSPEVQWDHSHTWDIPIFDQRKQQGSRFEIDLSKDSEHHYLMDHVIDGRPIMPAAAYLVLAWKALANREGKEFTEIPVMFEDVKFVRRTYLSANAKLIFEVKFIPGSNEFILLEGDDVIVSGRICVPDKKSLDVYFGMNSREVAGGIPDGLSPEDIYKDFRLKGLEYGTAFKDILGTNMEGTRSMVRWTGNWIRFIDMVSQMVILRLSDTYLPTGMTAVVIDPEQHDRHVQTLDEETLGIMTLFNPNTKDRIGGGVVLRNVQTNMARRTEPKPGVHESFKFFPYIHSANIPGQDKRLMEYTEQCKAVAASVLRNAVKRNIFKNSNIIEKLKAANYQNSNDKMCTRDSIQDGKAKTCLDVLQKMAHVCLGDINSTENTDITDTEQQVLASDILLGNLLQTITLKPCFDIVVENTSGKKTKIVEICTPNCSERIHEEARSNTMLRSSYHCATTDVETFNQSHQDNDSLEAVAWAIGHKVPDQLKNANLVIANSTIRKQINVNDALSDIKEMLSEDGFVLLHEVTKNFHIAAPLDGLYSRSVPDFVDLKNRTCGSYCDAETWIKIFQEEGFELIYKVSDNLLSTLFLFRKRVTNAVEKQTVIDITCNRCDWVEEVKNKIASISTKGKGEHLWLRSDNKLSGIIGLMNCLRQEPGGDRLRCIFNMDDSVPLLDDKVMQMLVSRDLFMNVYKNGEWGSYTHFPLKPELIIPSAHAYVNILKRGDLSSLSWVQSRPSKNQPSETNQSVMCSVSYAALNFRDIMLATGKLAQEAIPGAFNSKLDCLLGLEFSGRDTDGNRIMGQTPYKGLATSVVASKNLIWQIPDKWTLEQAATIPVAYTTAIYALVLRGQIESGKSILIHTGSGAVGQASIRVALHYGCKVFTTVGSVEKRKFLQEIFPQLDDNCFFSSRDTAFEEGILNSTSGRGVDIVLNTLAEEKLQASVRVLADHGTFLELGKYDLANNTPLGMSCFLKNIAFHGILLDSLFVGNNKDLQTVSRCIDDGIKSGMIQPLNSTVFEKDDVEGAFRYMARGSHIGKVLIKIRNDSEPVLVPAIQRTTFDPDKTYIITGGLGGFGLELAEWLVERGAKSLVLTSRTGIRTGYQAFKVRSLRNSGAAIVVSIQTVKDKEDARQLLNTTNKPVGGVFHLAMVLRDSLFENQSQETFLKVIAPKLTGALNLDHVTREICNDSLDWFVVFSSISSGYGNAGQSNYGFANAGMERIIEERAKNGYPGLAIQWGPIGDVGVFINEVGDNDTVMGFTEPQRLRSCFQSLDMLMSQSEPIVTSYVPADKDDDRHQSSANIVEAMCGILGIKDVHSIDYNREFRDIGLDSLLTVQIKVTLETGYNIVLNPKQIRELTICKLLTLAKGEYDTDETTYVELLVAAQDINALPMKTVRKINDIDEGTPMFDVHHIFGTIQNIIGAFTEMKLPVYGIERTLDTPLDTMEAIAQYYKNAIQQISKGKPFHLAGFSFGAVCAQEIALQFQEDDRSDDILSLILLDSSHKTTRACKEAQVKYPNILTIQLYRGMGLDFLKDTFSEENQERLTKTLSVLFPDLSGEGLDKHVQNTLQCMALLKTYRPLCMYHRDLTLVKADMSASVPDMPDDYGLSEYCTGRITVEEVKGYHVNFMNMNKSGDQVVDIIRKVVS